jgi:hypothetical protein
VAYPFPTSDKILHQFEGSFTKYEGLPHNDPREQTLSVITDGAPSPQLFHRLDEEYGKTHLIFPYSMSEVIGFRHFLPSTYYKIASNTGMPEDVDPRTRMLQAHTELHTKSSTIDSGVINGRRDMGTALSKVRQYLRISNLFEQIGLPTHATAADFAPFTEERLDEILIQVKLRMLDLMREADFPITTVPEEEFTAGPLPARFGYVNHLRRTLGDNLTAVVGYGSATRTEDIEKYGDYDNWLIVEDVERALRQLKGFRPHYDIRTDSLFSADEHVIASWNNPAVKHVGLLIFPNDQRVLHNYMRSLHDIEEFRTTILPLYGAVRLPNPTHEEAVERGISQAYIKAKTLAGSVTLFYDDPSLLLDKPALFDFFCKNTRFFYKHARKHADRSIMTKEEADAAMLAEHGIRVLAYMHDPGYISDALLYSRIATAYLQEQMLGDATFDGSYFTGDTLRVTADAEHKKQ